MKSVKFQDFNAKYPFRIQRLMHYSYYGVGEMGQVNCKNLLVSSRLQGQEFENTIMIILLEPQKSSRDSPWYGHEVFMCLHYVNKYII
jgi:hypothetical protein